MDTRLCFSQGVLEYTSMYFPILGMVFSSRSCIFKVDDMSNITFTKKLDKKTYKIPEVARLIEVFEKHYGCAVVGSVPVNGFPVQVIDEVFVQLALKKLARLMKRESDLKESWDSLSEYVNKIRGYPLKPFDKDGV